MIATALSLLGEHGSASMPKPALVVQSETLMERFQSGDEEGIQENALLLWNMIVDAMNETINDGDDRTLSYSAPQLAQLAERVGWLRK